MLWRLARCSLLSLWLGLLLGLAAESYEDRLAATDRQNPDALYELVVWCRENQFHARANQHVREIFALNPNHGPTRELMGFVWTGNTWVHESRLPADQRPRRSSGPAQPELRRRQSSGPGPRADAIAWDLSIPAASREEERFRPFIESVMQRMLGQDIFEMEGNWRTLMRPEHRQLAVSMLAQGIKDGSYTDLWGPTMIAHSLWEENNQSSRQLSRSLLPFLVLQSNRNRNPDAILAFTGVAPKYQDPRVVPRLIELLQSSMPEAQSGARQALAAFILCREVDVTVDLAKDWWARHHQSSRATVLSESLSDPNPWIRLGAVAELSRDDAWDERVIPVLIRLSEDQQPAVIDATGRELARLTGSHWGLNRGSSSDQRQRIREQLREWWEGEQANFVPAHLRGRASAQSRDPVTAWVRQLGATDGAEIAAATNQIRRRGTSAIPALIAGLEDGNGIVRNRARDLLREISGQNFGFEGIRGSDAARQEGVQRWRQWAQEAGHLQP